MSDVTRAPVEPASCGDGQPVMHRLPNGHVERGEAAAIVERVPATFGERVAPVHMAWAHHTLGQRDEAVVWLERGYQRYDVWINNLAVDPLLDGIQSDPRVRRLLARPRLADVSVVH